MRARLELYLLCLLVTTCHATPQGCSTLAGFVSSVYKTTPTRTLCVYVLNPTEHSSDAGAPAVLFFFGGGWMTGTPAQFASQARYVSSRGMVAMLTDYRVRRRDGTSPFEAVEDARSVVRWARSHAAELGIDPTKIVAAGGSAGGHVAAATAMLPGPDSEGDNLHVPCRPDALVLFNPVVDTSPRGYGAALIGPNSRKLSLTDHVSKGLPPMIIFHGTDDRAVPFATIQEFVKRVRAAGNRCELVPYPGAGHGFFNSPEFRPDTVVQRYEDTLTKMADFLHSIGILR